jgi:hypothetical protein
MLAQLDPAEYDHLIRELVAELRLAPELEDFVGGAANRSAVTDEFGTGPGDGRVPAIRTSDARHAHAVARFLQGRNIRV